MTATSQPTRAFDPFDLVLDAFVPGEYSGQDSPLYTTIRITPEFLDRLRQLSDIVRENDLWLVHQDPKAAMPQWSNNDAFEMESDVLGMNGDGVAFVEATPRFGSYRCQSRDFTREDLLEALAHRDEPTQTDSTYQWHEGALIHAGGPRETREIAELWLDEQPGNDEECLPQPASRPAGPRE